MSELHQVAFEKTESGHNLTFTCFGNETSKCHSYPDCGCEFIEKSHEHPSVSHADCYLVSWFSNNGESASYIGDDGVENTDWGFYPPETRTGPIMVSLEDDGLMWEFEASQ